MENDFSSTCFFCGQEKKEHWDEMTNYFECNCEDAKKNREIDRKISDLEYSRPKHKYKIGRGLVLI